MIPPALRVVHDTNVVLSALLFGGKARQLRSHWRQGTVVPVVCKDTVAELLLTLRYPKFKLTAADIEILLEDYLPYASICVLPNNNTASDALPQCRDAKDQVFLELAQASGAVLLLTGDADLLALRSAVTQANELKFTIMTLTELFNQYFIR